MNIPPATRISAMVPTKASALITKGSRSINCFPITFPILDFLVRSSIPKSSMRTIAATIPYTPIVATIATKVTTIICVDMGFSTTVPKAMITISTDNIKSVTMAAFIFCFSSATTSSGVRSAVLFVFSACSCGNMY